jgi:signal transduction histidine kinase
VNTLAWGRERLPPLLLWAGALAVLLTVPLMISQDAVAKELAWLIGTGLFVVMAALVWRRRRGEPVARWFALSAGLVGLVQAFDGLVFRITPTGDPAMVAWVILAYHLLMVVASIALTHLLGLFPDVQVERRYERRVITALWWLLPIPIVAMFTSPTLIVPSYHQLADVVNPYQFTALASLGTPAAVAVSALQGIFIVGAMLLIPRYLRSDADRRRRIRWLLIPALFAAAVAVTDLLAWRSFPDGAPTLAAEIVLNTLWIAAIASLPVAITVALLRPTLLDVDVVIRRSLVYGLLWALIAGTYVAAAAALGMVAGRRFPLGLAIGLTVVATLLFQPARRRLERAADRWVFGARTDPARLIATLGAELEGTVELESLLPRMADTLQEGLGLRWARVRLEPLGAPQDEDTDPALTVPIHLDDERLGVVECGPKLNGHLTEDDRAVVTTFARQAALAVRNVRLTAELERSRARLVRAQEAERRRIERNLHDGVQQDLVALLGHTARVRTQLPEHVPGDGIDELQAGLRHVLDELRELARGIHPSLLTDRGLLEAVEALAARSSVPVAVRADPALRGVRFAEEIEGAGYFTVAEALANVGKHAHASQVDVQLALSEGSLQITVRDDGRGFDPATAVGDGLVNLAERLAALGGRLQVDAAAGAGSSVTARLRVADG